MLFYYKRIEDPERKIESKYEDCFNTNDVLRGAWMDDNYFVITLRDGHEESQFVTQPKMIKGKLVGEKSRMYTNTHLALNKFDADRLKGLVGTSAMFDPIFTEEEIIPEGDKLKPWNTNPAVEGLTENKTQEQVPVESETINY